jgi:acyl carrier protein
MIPSAVVWHDALPLTRNGKLDRSRLVAADVPDPAPAGPAAGAGLPAPTGPGPATAPSAADGGATNPGAADGGAANPAAADGGAGPAHGGPIDELAAIWAGILRVPRVAADDSFYDLGGDSLAAARVLTEVRKRFRVTIPLDQLYDVRTVRAMAARVAAATQGSPR